MNNKNDMNFDNFTMDPPSKIRTITGASHLYGERSRLGFHNTGAN